MKDVIIYVYVYILTALFGLCIGSFLNVVIYRVPRGESIVFPPSHCPECNCKLRLADNIPVISYVLLRGRCRNCRTRISIRYPVIELTNMALWIVCSLFVYESSAQGAALLIFSALASSALLCIAVIDIEHKIIPDSCVLLLLCIGVAVTVTDGALTSHLLGMIIGGGGFFIVYLIARAALSREGMGLGDVKLMAAAGLLLGAERTFLSVLVSSVLGAIWLGTLQYVSRSEKGREYPFAPFLSFGIFTAMVFGDAVIDKYMELLLL